jgi:3',5'-cyclic AMP phosphodiesterase CpdA
MKFIHISDLHYHKNKKDNKAADKVLKALKANYPKHNLIVTGDITDDGHNEQYENAYKALNPFKGKVFIVPGNHDFGAAGNLFSKERALRFDSMLSQRLDQGGTFTGDNTPIVHVLEEGNTRVMLIGLDTNLETLHPFDFACGVVGEEQLSGLDAILSNTESASMIKILFFHHHPFMHGNPFMQLSDAEQLMRTIYNRIDVLLFGHKHTSEKWENYGSIKYVLASDNSPGKDWAREITVKGSDVSMEPIMFNPT